MIGVRVQVKAESSSFFKKTGTVDHMWIDDNRIFAVIEFENDLRVAFRARDLGPVED